MQKNPSETAPSLHIPSSTQSDTEVLRQPTQTERIGENFLNVSEKIKTKLLHIQKILETLNQHDDQTITRQLHHSARGKDRVEDYINELQARDETLSDMYTALTDDSSHRNRGLSIMRDKEETLRKLETLSDELESLAGEQRMEVPTQITLEQRNERKKEAFKKLEKLTIVRTAFRGMLDSLTARAKTNTDLRDELQRRGLTKELLVEIPEESFEETTKKLYEASRMLRELQKKYSREHENTSKDTQRTAFIDRVRNETIENREAWRSAENEYITTLEQYVAKQSDINGRAPFEVTQILKHQIPQTVPELQSLKDTANTARKTYEKAIRETARTLKDQTGVEKLTHELLLHIATTVIAKRNKSIQKALERTPLSNRLKNVMSAVASKVGNLREIVKVPQKTEHKTSNPPHINTTQEEPLLHETPTMPELSETPTTTDS